MIAIDFRQLREIERAGKDDPAWFGTERNRMARLLFPALLDCVHVLIEDAAGRPVTELLRVAADSFTARGDGPIAGCLRMKADEIDAALAELGRQAKEAGA